MAGKLRLRPPSAGDIDALVADMRPLDRQEVEASSGAGWRRELEHGLATSVLPFAAEDDDGLAALFGVKPLGLLSDAGQPWMLGTTRMAAHGRSLGLISRRYIAEASRSFALLTNYVDARNAPSIRFLRWLGFTIEPARPFGAGRLPFHRFELRSDKPKCAAPPPQARFP